MKLFPFLAFFLIAVSNVCSAQDITPKGAQGIMDALGEALAVGGYDTGATSVPSKQRQALADLLKIQGLLRVTPSEIRELARSSFFGVLIRQTDETEVHFYAIGKARGTIEHLGFFTAEAIASDIQGAEGTDRAALKELFEKGDLKTFVLHDPEVWDACNQALKG